MLTSTKDKGRSLRGRVGTQADPRSGLTQTVGGGFIGVATKSGAFVPANILDSFVGKQESQQIRQEDFQGIDGLVEPLYDPPSLARHMEANTYHARAVRTKAQDTAGQGWELAPLVEKPD